MNAILYRIFNQFDLTLGILKVKSLVLGTLEPPWNENRANESCIPCGHYVCRRIESPKFGPTFEVTNVPERTEIIFHEGNTAKDTQGCILLGKGIIFEPPFLGTSKMAMEDFMIHLAAVQEFELDIKELWSE